MKHRILPAIPALARHRTRLGWLVGVQIALSACAVVAAVRGTYPSALVPLLERLARGAS